MKCLDLSFFFPKEWGVNPLSWDEVGCKREELIRPYSTKPYPPLSDRDGRLFCRVPTLRLRDPYNG